MEKQGIVRQGVTPDTEQRLAQGEKQASQQATTKALDNDAAKRLADQAAKSLK